MAQHEVDFLVEPKWTGNVDDDDGEVTLPGEDGNGNPWEPDRILEAVFRGRTSSDAGGFPIVESPFCACVVCVCVCVCWNPALFLDC